VVQFSSRVHQEEVISTMNKIIYIIIQVIIIIVPIFLGIQNPTVAKRHIIEIAVILSIFAFEGYAYSIYSAQKSEMPDIHEAIKVKIIAGKFTDGIFNSDLMKMNDYPRITNEATIAFGNTSIGNDIAEKMQRYPIDTQLYDYLFLKVLSNCYHRGWYLVQKKPLKTESIFINPQYSSNKDNTNVYMFKNFPEYLKANNLYFNNKDIFRDGSYVGERTITLFPLLENNEPFRMVLPPGVKFGIGVGKDGWPDGTYNFRHKYFTLTMTIQAFSAGPGYPIGFHKQNDQNITEDFKKVRSAEMIVNFDAKFKQSLNEQELKDLYYWATTLLESFRFYFDYEEFEKSFKKS